MPLLHYLQHLQPSQFVRSHPEHLVIELLVPRTPVDAPFAPLLCVPQLLRPLVGIEPLRLLIPIESPLQIQHHPLAKLVSIVRWRIELMALAKCWYTYHNAMIKSWGS
jgi:hypothetical protein